MSNLIELARARKAAAEELAQTLQAQLEDAKREVAGWQEFIDRAETLASREDRHAPRSAETLRVQRNSWAGICAGLVKEKGPRALKDLVQDLRAMGKGSDGEKFSAVVNSALWRRDDLFERKDGLYHLRTQDFEFVD